MKSAKEWFYSQYVVGGDDKTDGTYEWFDKMERYAQYKIDELSKPNVLHPLSHRVCEFCGCPDGIHKSNCHTMRNI